MSTFALQASHLTDDAGDAGEGSDREFLTARAALYAEKAELAANSGLALVRDAQGSFANLDDVDADFDQLLRAYADRAGNAAEQHVEVVRAITGSSFADFAVYPELLAEQRASVQFLSAEAAQFRAMADDDLDPDSGEEEIDEGIVS